MEHKEYKAINKSVRKKDAMQLLLGKPVYTDDIASRDALVVKILRSPHANAMVESVDTRAAKLVPGTKIAVTGYKAEWAGEVEIMDGTFEFLDAETFVAEPLDVTAMIGTDELVAHQNEKVAFKGMTVDSIEYKNGEPGDDIYVTLSKDGNTVSFCVEVYLTGTDSEVYQTVGGLKAGDVVDVEAFLYWYEGANPPITAITAA